MSHIAAKEAMSHSLGAQPLCCTAVIKICRRIRTGRRIPLRNSLGAQTLGLGGTAVVEIGRRKRSSIPLGGTSVVEIGTTIGTTGSEAGSTVIGRRVLLGITGVSRSRL